MRRLTVISLATAVITSTALVGCMVGPDFTKPEIATPKTFRYEPDNARKTVNPQWWKQFNDPVLDQLITEGLANNKDIKIAAANVERAAGVLRTTDSSFFPQVGYQADGSRQRYPDQQLQSTGTLDNPSKTLSVGANISWELDFWGRLSRLSEAAQAQLLATEQAQRSVILTLTSSIASSYIELRGLDEQLLMAKSTAKTYAESLRLMELKFKYGRVSEMEVEQARVRYQTAAAQIPLTQREIALLENKLSILLGKNPDTIPRGKAVFALGLPDIPAGLPSDLLEQRPDLLQSLEQLKAANAQIGAAKALYYPNISLTAGQGTVSDQLDNLFDAGTKAWRYGGTITGPIFTAGNIAGQVEQAEAQQKAALLAYEKAVQSAFADVENSLVSREKIGVQLVAQQQLVDALRNYAKIAQLQYDYGRSPYSTVLQAQEQLFPAELKLATVRADLAVSMVNVYKATGGGWVDKAAAMTTADATEKNVPGKPAP